jgi:hypothetical protein
VIYDLEFEMPAECTGCGDTFDLNTLWSCPDGGIRCADCKERFDEGDSE